MPIMGPNFDKEAMLNKVQEAGIFTILFDVEAFGFLLYQVIGVIILIVFMMFTLVGMILLVLSFLCVSGIFSAIISRL